MRTYAFPASIVEIEPGEFEVRFRDLPEVLTFAGSVDEALFNASDAIAAVVGFYLNQDRDVPMASKPLKDEYMVSLPLPTAVRAALNEVVKERKLSKVALAAELNKDEKAARRLLSGKGASLEQGLLALRALGVQPVLSA